MKKIFVLDTSVIIYDHEAITHFEEHDVAIPIAVLEELDNFKKGNPSIFLSRPIFPKLLPYNLPLLSTLRYSV